MKKSTVYCLGILILTLLPICLHSAEPQHFGNQQPVQFKTEIKVKMGYLLFLPAKYETQESWPLMLFLHGSGERGNDLNLVEKHGPPKLVETDKDFPFILVSPQCQKDRWWEPVSLTALLDQIVAKYKVDEDRIYVTGLSMGGFGTWRLATYTPERFAAIVPICGGGEPIRAERIAHIPAWVFHGAKDPAVPLQRSQEMVDALRAEGGHVKFTVYPEAGHNAWTKTYANPELYDWLLKQRRPHTTAKE